MNEQNCGQCRYFHTNSLKDARKVVVPVVGVCKRYPPAVIAMQDRKHSGKRTYYEAYPDQHRPIMNSEDTCGEWKEV